MEADVLRMVGTERNQPHVGCPVTPIITKEHWTDEWNTDFPKQLTGAVQSTK